MMDSKRKANGTATADPDDRSSKRRKLAEFDLSKGESRESTTAYGMSFLEQIRRTADKSGRLVATYFENLLSREGNEEYYKRTRMPISLRIVEDRLSKGDFRTLAELESYFKRMIANAKEFYPRSSPVFDDAERVRKALSNYMTKTNPAYGTRGYQAQPTPLPPEDGDEEDEDEDADGEVEEGDGEAEENGGNGAEEENGDDEDAEGEVAQPDAADGDEEEEPAASRSPRKRSIVLKRRESGRLARTSAPQAQPSPRQSSTPARLDHQYENVPYKGLSFQQAQEKIVEELLRYNEPEFEAYFEPFHNLPPRALRDYYRVVTDPLSLKKLQKMIKGVHGRHDATGVSEFKNWGVFEEKSKLLWTNAYFYNEEGSEIYELGQELEKAFYEHLKKARAVVPEPTQPKIKLKVGQASEALSSSKKITIHVGGRGGSTDSPAPNSAQPNASLAAGLNGVRVSNRLEAARSVSVSAPSPSPSTQPGLKMEDSTRMSPAVSAPIPVSTPVAVRPLAAAIQPQPQLQPQPQPQLQPQVSPQVPLQVLPQAPPEVHPVEIQPLVNGHVEQKRLRRPGKGINDALISRLRLQLHPNMQVEHPNVLTVLPHPQEPQQSATVSLAPHYNRVFIVLKLPDLLYDRQYSLWVLIDKQSLKPCMHPLPNQHQQERAFEVVLHPGINVIEAHLIAAIPRSEREQGGPEAELEVFTVFANLMRT